MIRILYKNEQGALDTNLQIRELGTTLNDPESLLWLYFTEELETQVEAILPEEIKMVRPICLD